MRGVSPPIWALLAVLLLGALVYVPGLSGSFVFDDAPNIVDNRRQHIEDLSWDSLVQGLTSAPSGNDSRPLSNLSFAINHALTGLNVWWYKTTNLAIHLINGLLVYLAALGVLRGLDRRTGRDRDPRLAWVAVTATALWLLHPLNLSPVLYVVQRQASLAALFMLLGMVLYLQGRLRLLDGRGGVGLITAAWLVCTPLALFSKQNGVLLPLLLWVIEFTVFRFRGAGDRPMRGLHVLFVAIVWLPALGASIYILTHPDWLAEQYFIKPFTLAERLMTEPRVLWFYLAQILLPNIREMSLFHDDYVVSTGLFTPWTTLPALLAWIGALAGVFWLRGRQPILAFAIAFFIAGHAIESTIFGLLIAQDHRNYLPSLGPLLALSHYLVNAALHPATARLRRITAVLMVLMFGSLTVLRSTTWGSPLELAIAEVENHPDSARANYMVGRTYAEALLDPEIVPAQSRGLFYENARKHMLRSHDLSPTNLLGLASTVLLNAHTHHPIPDSLIDRIIDGLRSPKSNIDHLISLRTLESASRVAPKALPMTTVEYLNEVALDNPHLSDHMRAAILSNHAKLLWEHRPDQRERVIRNFREASRLRPKMLPYRVNLAHALVQTGRWDEAEDVLDALDQADTVGAYRREERLIRQALETRRAAASRLDAD